MRDRLLLNGCDYLMLGFDHELRRHGFAGNSCQIVMDLASRVSAKALQDRADTLCRTYPVLQARLGGWVLPRWKSRHRVSVPAVRSHNGASPLAHDFINQPLAIHHGELFRFDLIEDDRSNRSKVIFTWAHALMDAPGAESFLVMLGREGAIGSGSFQPAIPRTALPLAQKFKSAWRNIYQLDEFCRAAPRGLGTRFPNEPRRLRYRIEPFSAEETRLIRANAVQHCGVVGDAQYHAAVAVTELHQLHRRLGAPSPSYVLPIPVGLRPKGSVEPVFGNQVGMLMTQFVPEHLDSVTHAATVLKKQMEQALRAKLLESGITLSELFRFLPLPVYTAVLKRGLRGEICSLFYGDTGAVNPLLTEFLGARVDDFSHIAAITPSPGVGVIFYYFKAELRMTVLHLATVLSDAEAAEFAAALRVRLLKP